MVRRSDRPEIPQPGQDAERSSYDDTQRGELLPAHRSGSFLFPRGVGAPADAENRSSRNAGATRSVPRLRGEMCRRNGPGCDPFFEKTLRGDAEKICP
jgi:hypothetical protein